MKRPGEDFVRLLYACPSHPMPRQVVFRRLRALLHLQAASRGSSGNEDIDAPSADPLLITARFSAAGRHKNPRRMKWPCVPVGGKWFIMLSRPVIN